MAHEHQVTAEPVPVAQGELVERLNRLATMLDRFGYDELAGTIKQAIDTIADHARRVAELEGDLIRACDQIVRDQSLRADLEAAEASLAACRAALQSIVADHDYCGDEWGVRRDAWIETARAALSQDAK